MGLHWIRVTAGATAFDLREPGAAENIGIAFAAARIVATDQSAIASDDAGIACAEQRRALVVGGKIGEPRDHVGASIMDRHTGRGGVRRAAGNAGIGQIGCARTKLELIEIEAEPVGRDLCQRRPCALAHIMRADLHDAAAIAAQHRLGLRRKHVRRKCRGAHAPADKQAVTIAHLPRRKRPTLPAEPLGALPVAFAQGF